jgi:hypothetical protein
MKSWFSISSHIDLLQFIYGTTTNRITPVYAEEPKMELAIENGRQNESDCGTLAPHLYFFIVHKCLKEIYKFISSNTAFYSWFIDLKYLKDKLGFLRSQPFPTPPPRFPRARFSNC